MYRTATVGQLQKRVCVAVWEHWHGSDVFWWGRLAQSCWRTGGVGSEKMPKNRLRQDINQIPREIQRHAACPEACQRFRASATRTVTSKSNGSKRVEMRLWSFWGTKIILGFRQGKTTIWIHIQLKSKCLRTWKPHRKEREELKWEGSSEKESRWSTSAQWGRWMHQTQSEKTRRKQEVN